MSLTKRTTVPILLAAPYSASQVPAAMPSGVPMPIAIRHITALPKQALRRPPALIGGGVSRVHSASLMLPRRLATSVYRIQIRTSRPSPPARHVKTRRLEEHQSALQSPQCYSYTV